jgi:geranylgeranyl pyrophosphate synthase
MLQAELNRLLQEEIENVLVPLSDDVDFYNLVRVPLAKVRQELVADNMRGKVWGTLPLIVCDGICGRFKHVLPLCAGLELLKAAAEVFDDIEDADSAESLSAKYGTPLAINTASTLLILAEKAFTRLNNRGVDSAIVVSLIDTVNSYYTIACTGQHLDLSLRSEEAISEDDYMRIIAMKSASVVECACYTGALLAAANQETKKSMKIFGHNLGMASQIANDIKGVTSLRDIRKRKITLPAIFALGQTDGETHQQLEQFFMRPETKLLSSPVQIGNLLFSTGAIQYATIKMELYKQQAMDILIELEQMGIKVEQLQQFLN